MTVEMTGAPSTREDQLARRGCLPGGLVARAEFLRRRLPARGRWSGATLSCSVRAGFEPLEPAGFELLAPLFGTPRPLFVGEILVLAAEIGDAQAELVFAVYRKDVIAIHRAAQRIGQVDARVALGQHVVGILRPPVHQPHDACGLRRHRLAVDRKLGNRLRRLHVLFHQQRRDRQHVAVVVEAVSRVVHGELIGRPRRHAEQVADGVVVFDAVEAPRGDASRDRFGLRRRGGETGQFLDPVDDSGALGIRQRLRRRRRHRSGRHLVEHVLPDRGMRRGGGRIAQRLEAQLAGLRLVAMASQAALGKHRQHVLLKFRCVRLRCLRLAVQRACGKTKRDRRTHE